MLWLIHSCIFDSWAWSQVGKIHGKFFFFCFFFLAKFVGEEEDCWARNQQDETCMIYDGICFHDVRLDFLVLRYEAIMID